MKNNWLKLIISEEYQALRNVEYRDEDTINPTYINLREEYDKLNTQLFNNELPRIQMKWSNRKTNLGHVVAEINRNTNEGKIKNLAISSFHAITYKIFRNTLAHEMIHVKLILNGENDLRNPHGWAFLNEASRINKMGLGYNITRSSEAQLNMSDMAKQKAGNKTFICLLIERDGRKYLNVTTEKVYDAEGQNVFNLFQNLVNRGKYNNVNINVVKSNNPELMKYKITRTFRRGLSYTPINPEFFDKLLQGEVIKSERIERNMSESENVDNASDWVEVTIV